MNTAVKHCWVMMLILVFSTQPLLANQSKQRADNLAWQHSEYHAEHLAHGHDVTESDLSGHTEWAELERLHAQFCHPGTVLYFWPEQVFPASMHAPVFSPPSITAYMPPSLLKDTPPPRF